MRARKRFAQHFLEPAWVAKLVAAIEPLKTDRMIEIGPGHGAITIPLAAKVDRLLAIEVDRDLAAALDARALPNVTVVTADVLAVSLVDLARSFANDAGAPGSRLRVVGNLPYNISSPILFRLIDAAPAAGLGDATLMLQEEVADRLVAGPGTGEYGVLTLCTALGADVTRLLSLPPGAFRPAPKVRSAVVRLTFRPPPPEIRDPKHGGGHGSVRLHAAPQDHVERAGALCRVARPRGQGRAGTSGDRPPAPARNVGSAGVRASGQRAAG